MFTNQIPRRAVALATVLQFVVLFGFKTVAQAQTGEANPSENPAAGAAAAGNELQQVVVTGSLTPRIGQGPQPVTTYDQD